MKALIQKLVESTGPSGYESGVREVIKTILGLPAEALQVDALGNLIVRKGSRQSNGLRIMLAAHMDEIGVIATYIEQEGFIRFTNIGGVRAANCIGGRVRFVNGVQGVIYMDRTEHTDRIPTLDKLYIDVGATSRENCPIKVSDMGVFDRPFLDLGDRLASKAMDDRIGVAVLVEVIHRLNQSPHEVVFVFSTQEEVGLRGATTAAYHIDPDLGISVDVTMTGDTPKALKMEVGLGNGPAIKVRDSGMLSDPRVVQVMIDAAARAGLPYQLEVLEGGTTDARAMQLTRAGVPSGCVSIPCRYVHSQSEMVSLKDVENAVQLLVELLSQPVKLT
jgi:endoglucanase